MKKVFFLVFTIVVSTLSYAQIENIKINNDSTLVINKVYAGMLSGSLFSLDSV